MAPCELHSKHFRSEEVIVPRMASSGGSGLKRIPERKTANHGLALLRCIVRCLIAAVSLLFSTAKANHSVCHHLQPSPPLTPFVDPLPIPASIFVSDGIVHRLGACILCFAGKLQKLHRDLPPTTLYAYGTSQRTATYPGPTLEAIKDKAALIKYENHIPDREHFLTVDRTLLWANPPHGGVPIVTHLHEGEVHSTSDGNPQAWFTMNFRDRGPAWVTPVYRYPNEQPATTLWYHDHTLGITRLNVVAGLAGFYILRDPLYEPANLPSGTNEIPLLIQDKQFWPNGSINFPDVGNVPEVHPNWCPEYFGDTILVNGKVWPYLEVYPEMYRFRILDGANSRFFTLTLSDPSLRFIQIGTDGGFLPTPLNLTEITLAPAYRVDVLVDFSNIRVGTTVYMNNTGRRFQHGKSDSRPWPPPMPNTVMAFKIVSRAQGFPSQNFSIPSNMAPVPRPQPADRHRRLTLVEVRVHDQQRNDSGTIEFLLNGMKFLDPPTETPAEGSIEIWYIINLTHEPHPIHLHLITFLVLSHQSFDRSKFIASNCSLSLPFPDPGSCFTEAPQQPDVTQVGWKDTVIVPPGVTAFWTKWSPRDGGEFPFDPTTGPGYVWHCHILDHEDNEMMRPLLITHHQHWSASDLRLPSTRSEVA